MYSEVTHTSMSSTLRWWLASSVSSLSSLGGCAEPLVCARASGKKAVRARQMATSLEVVDRIVELERWWRTGGPEWKDAGVCR